MEWIPVAERLPDRGVVVLICTPFAQHDKVWIGLLG